MLGGMSLRQRLLTLTAVAVLPMAVLAFWVTARETNSTIALAQSQLRFSASLLASNQSRAIDTAEQLLTAIAGIEELRNGSRERCQAYLEDLLRRYPMYSNFGFAQADGTVLCHGLGAKGYTSAAGRDYLNAAIDKRTFVLGAPINGRVSGRRALPMALPVVRDGVVTVVAFATLDLAYAASLLTRAQIPEGARVVVADRRGTVLIEHPAPAYPDAARTIADEQLKAAAQGMTADSGEARDSQGVDHVFAYAPSRRVGEEGLMVRVAMPRSVILADGNANMLHVFLVLGLAMLAALVGTWFLGGRAIVAPAQQVMGAVRRLEKGDLDARVPLRGPGVRGEFERMGAAFNLMADSLQRRQLDLESELERSRSAYELLDQVLNGMQDALIAVSPQGRLLLHNRAALQLFDLSAPPLTLSRWPAQFGCYYPDRTTPYLPHKHPVARAAAGQAGGGARMYVRNANVPEGRMLMCSWQPFAGGAIAGGIVVFSDITQLQQLQDAQAGQLRQLVATQRKLNEAQQAGRIGNWELDLVEGRLWWSDQVFDLLGLRRDSFEVTVANFDSLIHPHDKAVHAAARQRAIDTAGSLEVDYRLIRSDGQVIWLHDVAATRAGPDGRVAWIGGLVQDITVRKLAQAELTELNASLEARITQRTAELARQEQLFRTLAEQAPEVVWNTDAAGTHLTFVNRAWCELVGGTPQDWIGGNDRSTIHPDDVDAVSEKWRHSARTLDIFTGERRIRASDGTFHTMSYKASPVLDADGEVAFWVGIETDITGLKAIELALRSSNQELEAFSYSVSHDLRAPLGAISGFSKALAAKIEGQADERSLHYLARIQAGVGKMEQLIDALLSLSKVARASFEWTMVDLGAIAQEIMDDLKAQQPDRQVDVAIEQGLVAQGDAPMLRVLLQNLLGNAWKFTTHQQHARIELGRLKSGGPFYVRDNGVGFDMSYATKLFVAFQRLHSEAEFPGTGIGLATVRRIVLRHHGKVWAESSPGQSTVFYFTLSQVAPPAWLATDIDRIS